MNRTERETATTRRELMITGAAAFSSLSLFGACRSETMSDTKPSQLSDLGNVVPPGYEYYEKLITPRAGLQAKGAYLKWYDIYRPELEITEAQRAAARELILSESQQGRLALQGELGFVLFHRAGSMLLLMIITWRNTNELWESIYHAEVDGNGKYWEQKFDSSHRGTYCVWELGAVWHERNAWVKFIRSARDEAAKLAYLSDQFTGRV